MIDLQVAAPNGIGGQRVHSAIGSVNAMKFDAESESHLLIIGFDVDKVADFAEGGSDIRNSELHEAVVGIGELPDGMLGVGIDHDGQLHLAFELVELSGVLRLGEGVLVAGNVLDLEIMLLEDIFAFSSVAKIIVAEIDTASVDWNTVGEASVLDSV